MPRSHSHPPTLGAVVVALLSISIAATSLNASAEVVLEDFWIRAMPPGQPMAAGYGAIVNRGDKPVQITGLSSNIAQHAELHSSVHDNGRVHMMPMTLAPLAPGARIELSPGGDHLMLMGVTQAPQMGGKVELCISLTDTDVSESSQACHEIPVLQKAPSQGED